MAINKPMKVLFIGIEGCETFLLRLIRGLQSESVQITLAFPTKKLPKGVDIDRIDLLWTPNWSGNLITRILNLFFLFLKRFDFNRARWLLQQATKEKDFRQKLLLINRYLPFCKGNWDIIYFAWNATAIDYSGLYDLHIPIIVSCRGSQLKVRPVVDKNKRYIEDLSRTLRHAAAVHCISKDLQRIAIKYGAREDCIKVIYPAIDPNFFKPSIKYEFNKRLIITMVGALFWLKGYEYGLIAFKDLIDAGIDAELNIIGEGPEKQNLIFSANDLKIETRVVFHGKLTSKAVRDQLQRTDIFLHSSVSEGFGNAVVEAQSCAVPVVCFDEGGLPENIKDHFTGFLVPVRDTKAMSKKLEILALNPLLRERMGDAGREHVLTDFDLADQVEAFVSMFKALLEN